MKDRLAELQDGGKVSSPPTTMWYDQSEERKLIVATDKRNNKRMIRVVRKTMLLLQVSSKFTKQVDSEENAIKQLKEQISSIRCHVSEITVVTKRLKEMHTSALMSLKVSSDDKAEMDRLVTQGRAAAKSAAHCINELAGANVVGGPSVQRMITQQTSYARLSFINAMEQFEKELERYSKGLRHYVAKQIATVGGDIDTADAESCIEQGKLNAFVDNYLIEEQQAKDTLEAVTRRQVELEKLEKTIIEVRDLFANVALLIATQGAVIDNIEIHVERAAAEATKGSKQLKQAGQKKRSALKKKAILGTVAGTVGVGLITALAIL